MNFRAVIYSVDHGINILWVNNKGNWFSFRGRSYRKDREAVCQVMEKGDRIKGTVESLYVEGNPIPLRSILKVEAVTKEHWDVLVAESGNKTRKEGFFGKLFGR